MKALPGSAFDPPTKTCRRCKQAYPRAMFRPALGPKAVLEAWCRECRKVHGAEQYSTTKKILRRLELKRITQEKADVLIAKIVAERAKRCAENSHAGRVTVNKRTWVMAERSARLAIVQVDKCNYPSQECLIWGVAVRMLLVDALAEIKKRKEKERLPTHRVMLWYDAIDGMPDKMRRLIAEYPAGASAAPIQIV